MSSQTIVGKHWPPPWWLVGEVIPGPTPEMLSPLDGDTIRLGQGNFYLHAVAPDGAPAVNSVEFFDGVTSLGVISSEPWALLVTGQSLGAHSYSAVFDYATGGDGTSDPIDVTVIAENSFDPTTVATLQGWQDPTDNGAITLDGSNFISAFANEVTSATSYTSLDQSNASRRPNLKRMRGRQCAYAGENTGSEGLIGILAATQAQPYRLWAVCRPTAITGVTNGVMASFATNSRLRFNGVTWPRNVQCNAGSSLTTTIPDPSLRLYKSLMNGASSAVQINDNAAVTGNAGAGTGATPISWMASSINTTPQKGAYGDMMMFQGTPSAQDLSDCSQYLIDKWDLTGETCQIEFIGDSITTGVDSTWLAGFRLLWYNQVAAEAKVHGLWVESNGSVDSSHYPDDIHEGNSGTGIAFVRTTVVPLLGTQYFPDVIHIMIGTNNTREAGGETWVPGTGPGTTIQAYADMLDEIKAALPDVIICVTTIIQNSNSTINDRVIEFNGNLPAVWDAFEIAYGAGSIFTWDANTIMGGPAYQIANSNDGVHPNDTGYTLLADGIRTPIVRAVVQFYNDTHP